MTSERAQEKPIDISNQVEEEFRTWIYNQMENQDYSESKKLFWAQYMLDNSRPQKIVKDFFSDSLLPIKRHRALDIGCGFGSLLMALQPHFEKVYGIDINKTYVQWSRKRVPRSEIIHANAKKLPWPDEWFDLVCATDMFEHIDYSEQQLVASELKRVLKPGGHGIIIVPNRFQILDEHNKVLFGTWLPASKREFYVRALSKNKHFDKCWERTGRGWKNLFENQGFEVTLKPHFMKGWNFLKYFFVPANRYKLYITRIL
ncbi:MAG: class I SAM-dependent methyltransferase [Xenococcus sp. MO_188.B8]|nr:class I SAM-dependent methyltransferase [Xenococcus sp. MO_188.B8]